jgi:hypothetical protein
VPTSSATSGKAPALHHREPIRLLRAGSAALQLRRNEIVMGFETTFPQLFA